MIVRKKLTKKEVDKQLMAADQRTRKHFEKVSENVKYRHKLFKSLMKEGRSAEDAMDDIVVLVKVHFHILNLSKTKKN